MDFLVLAISLHGCGYLKVLHRFCNGVFGIIICLLNQWLQRCLLEELLNSLLQVGQILQFGISLANRFFCSRFGSAFVWSMLSAVVSILSTFIFGVHTSSTSLCSMVLTTFGTQKHHIRPLSQYSTTAQDNASPRPLQRGTPGLAKASCVAFSLPIECIQLILNHVQDELLHFVSLSFVFFWLRICFHTWAAWALLVTVGQSSFWFRGTLSHGVCCWVKLVWFWLFFW